MKQFLKFLVSIIVIAIMIFTVYFLMQGSFKYIERNMSGDKEEISQINNGENVFEINQKENDKIEESNNLHKETENIVNERVSGEYITSGEKRNDNISGEYINDNKKYTIEEMKLKLDEIKKIEDQNKAANVAKTIEDSVGIDIIGVKNEYFFETFNLSEMSVTVQVAGSMIYIIPVSDFVDNAQFHFDENGSLILYVRELSGVGGEVRYYFENNQLLERELKIEEDIEIDIDDIDEIIQRAKTVYEKYMK